MANKKNESNNGKKTRLVYYTDKELATLFDELSVEEIKKVVKKIKEGAEV